VQATLVEPIQLPAVNPEVDQVIGCRQKKKGMSWRPKGSKLLAILKIFELNGQWENTWFATETA